MTDDNSNAPEGEGIVDIDLDTFEKDFFQTADKEPEKEPEEKEEVVENEDDSLATDEDTDASEDEKPTEDEAEGDEEEEPEEEPKPELKPKSKTQQRIEKLLERERVQKERADALEARLAKLEASKEKEVAEDKTPALRDQLSAEAPNPDAVNKDGDPVYPLGEFDPKFIRDLTKFSVDEQLRVAEEDRAKKAEAAKIEAAQEEIRSGWLDRVEKVEEEIPDLREHIADLTETFSDLNPQYGEYLATVIMASECGPEIMYYLSQNIGEAQKIVASGPAAATLALGRLEAKLSPTEQKEEKRNIKKQSNAPTPPTSRSRGSGAKTSVAADTDDLDAFERVFFKK